MAIVLLVALLTVELSAAPNLILKIEHKIADKETITDEFAITLVNKTDENPITSTNSESPSNFIESHINGANCAENKINGIHFPILYKQIPIIQIKPDNIDVKRQLDKFAMVRKKSFLTTVEFDFKLPKQPVRELVTKAFRNAYQTTEIQTEPSKEMISEFLSHPEMAHVIKRQSAIIDQLKTALSKEVKDHLSLRFEERNLMQELSKVRNNTKRKKQKVITRPGKETTVLNVIDDTAVREALKKDPLVKRVLQMGRLKRLAYKREVKEYVKG